VGGFDVSPAELQATRGFVNGVAKEVVNEVATVGLSIEALLDGGWSGGAATDFLTGWREWKQGARDTCQALDGMAVLLGMAGRDFADSDVFVADQFAKFSS
jgi:WXG100 family type VII secretion target